MKKFDKILYVQYYNFNGVQFYAAEYFIYLMENNLNFKLVFGGCTLFQQKEILKSFQEKYKKEYFDIIKENIIFTNNIIFSETCLVLDFSTISSFKIISKQYIYHYSDEIKSIELTENEWIKTQSKKNIICFGDKNIGKDIQYHYPLNLNFKMFRSIDIPNYQEKDISYIEDKTTFQPGTRKIFKNFHSTFNHLIFSKTNFDRANRLIPECKYFNKKITFIENENNIFDSIDDRLNKDWKEFDINESNFSNFIKEKL